MRRGKCCLPFDVNEADDGTLGREGGLLEEGAEKVIELVRGGQVVVWLDLLHAKEGGKEGKREGGKGAKARDGQRRFQWVDMGEGEGGRAGGGTHTHVPVADPGAGDGHAHKAVEVLGRHKLLFPEETHLGAIKHLDFFVLVLVLVSVLGVGEEGMEGVKVGRDFEGYNCRMVANQPKPEGGREGRREGRREGGRV